MKYTKQIIVAALLISLLISVTTFGNRRPVGVHGVGPRLGLTVNPDQFHVGVHFDLGDLASNLMMQPNLEIGFGDHMTTVAPSFEVDYRFRSDWGAGHRIWAAGLVQYSTRGSTEAVRPNLVSICSLVLEKDRPAVSQGTSS